MFDLSHDPLFELRDFFNLHNEAIQNAALLLGSRPALRRNQALLDDIAAAPRLNNRLRRELAALHALLTLKHAHDPDRIEAACFAEIDPASPIVEDLCLLTEAYQDVLIRTDDNFFPDHLAT
ncbi:hypothetical protein SAMN05444279_11411 [Ruegeria intermedia]|uniref:Uncharacterized protein n=1 Tax=Ruegeria intermedia TaxID=996115 RepID=A0A1M4Y5K0_9RHOB|nr:hypothetical protein [Ruegeria intermedia]SHF00950.1 hypothetical protein SAMN05444279_11411 [Ruegeria intermedia]